MGQDRELTLDFSEQVAAKVEQLAQKTGATPDQVVESIIREYLMRQLTIIEKRAAETGTPFDQLVNMQFERLLDFMLSRA